MTILNLASYYYPEQTAGSHLANDLEEAYVREGYKVVLYVPTPTRGITSDIKEKYKKIKYEERKDGKVIVHRFWTFQEHRNPVFRALRYTYIQVVQYFKAIKEKDIDIVYCSSTPPTQGIIGVLIAKKLSNKCNKRIPCVFELQDIFPESLVSTGLSEKNSLIYKMGDKIANYIYKNVNMIIVISEEFKKILIQKNVPSDKIEVIYNWVDENKVINIPREKNSLFDEYKLDKSKFYVAYSGNIGMTQNMDMLLDVAKELQVKEDIGFILVGDGAYKTQVERRIKEEKINNVTLIPFQPYERISEVFSLGDVGLIISKKGVGNNSVPSKTWSYMSAERPILASFDIDSELCHIISENHCGICIQPDKVDQLSCIIEEFTFEKSMGKNGKNYVKENLNKNTCTKKYLAVMQKVK